MNLILKFLLFNRMLKLTFRLFGEDADEGVEGGEPPSVVNPPQPSPNSDTKSWAKYKEQNPDEYARSMPDNVSEASSDIRSVPILQKIIFLRYSSDMPILKLVLAPILVRICVVCKHLFNISQHT